MCIPCEFGAHLGEGAIPVDSRWGLHQHAWFCDNDVVRAICQTVVLDCLEISFEEFLALHTKC